MGRRVVVTGLGALTPLGNNVPDFFESISNGKNGVGSISRFDTTHFKTKFACELKGFNPENHFDRKELRKLDPFCQYALIAADEAVLDAGINLSAVDSRRVGVIWGSGYGGATTVQDQVIDFAANGSIPRFTPFFLPRMIINMSAAMIAMKYGFKGINYGLAVACASSNVAIWEGFNHIRWGDADVIIAGGSEAGITEAGIGAFNAAMALSTNNEEYTTACRPFDLHRDGFVMGEGAGALVLEELEHAKQRGATIYAEVIGGAMTCDAYHITAPDPESNGVYHAMQLALDQAGITAGDVDYINAHATSTPLGDLCEINAIYRLFREHTGKLSVSASKSMMGHLLGAAGAAEAMVCIHALKTGIVAPSINVTEVDPAIPTDLNLTLTHPQKREITIAMSNTFGFGGQNVISVYRKYEG